MARPPVLSLSDFEADDHAAIQQVKAPVAAPHPSTLLDFAKKNGYRITPNGGFTHGTGHSKGSMHYQGSASDPGAIDIDHRGVDYNKLVAAAKAAGYNVLDEVRHPSAASTGPHYHISKQRQQPHRALGQKKELPVATKGPAPKPDAVGPADLTVPLTTDAEGNLVYNQITPSKVDLSQALKPVQKRQVADTLDLSEFDLTPDELAEVKAAAGRLKSKPKPAQAAVPPKDPSIIEGAGNLFNAGVGMLKQIPGAFQKEYQSAQQNPLFNQQDMMIAGLTGAASAPTDIINLVTQAPAAIGNAWAGRPVWKPLLPEVYGARDIPGLKESVERHPFADFAGGAVVPVEGALGALTKGKIGKAAQAATRELPIPTPEAKTFKTQADIIQNLRNIDNAEKIRQIGQDVQAGIKPTTSPEPVNTKELTQAFRERGGEIPNTPPKGNLDAQIIIDKGSAPARGGLENLTNKEKSAIGNYARLEYAKTNKLLREGSLKGNIDDIWQSVDSLSSAAKKFKTAEPMMLYRGVDHPIALSVGDLYTDKGFLSTSIDPSVALQHSRPATGKNRAAFKIELPAGEDHIPVSQLIGSSEGEVLLPPNKQYRVKAINTSESGLKVYTLEPIQSAQSGSRIKSSYEIALERTREQAPQTREIPNLEVVRGIPERKSAPTSDINPVTGQPYDAAPVKSAEYSAEVLTKGTEEQATARQIFDDAVQKYTDAETVIKQAAGVDDLAEAQRVIGSAVNNGAGRTVLDNLFNARKELEAARSILDDTQQTTPRSAFKPPSETKPTVNIETRPTPTREISRVIDDVNTPKPQRVFDNPATDLPVNARTGGPAQILDASGEPIKRPGVVRELEIPGRPKPADTPLELPKRYEGSNVRELPVTAQKTVDTPPNQVDGNVLRTPEGGEVYTHGRDVADVQRDIEASKGQIANIADIERHLQAYNPEAVPAIRNILDAGKNSEATSFSYIAREAPGEPARVRNNFVPTHFTYETIKPATQRSYLRRLHGSDEAVISQLKQEIVNRGGKVDASLLQNKRGGSIAPATQITKLINTLDTQTGGAYLKSPRVHGINLGETTRSATGDRGIRLDTIVDSSLTGRKVTPEQLGSHSYNNQIAPAVQALNDLAETQGSPVFKRAVKQIQKGEISRQTVQKLKEALADNKLAAQFCNVLGIKK